MNYLEKFCRHIIEIVEPDQRWAISGPSATALRRCLPPPLVASIEPFEPAQVAALDGLILAEALSAAATAPAEAWLEGLAQTLPVEATLLILDWQADGPPHSGPDIGRRFKLGRLRLRLRSWGFGTLTVLDNRPDCYIIKAVKKMPPPPPTDFVAVATLDELPRFAMKVVTVFGREVVVGNSGRGMVAFARRCPHADASLAEGVLRGPRVACPRHGYIWHVKSGQPLQPDDEDWLPCYTVRVEGRQVLVSLQPPE